MAPHFPRQRYRRVRNCCPDHLSPHQCTSLRHPLLLHPRYLLCKRQRLGRYAETEKEMLTGHRVGDLSIILSLVVHRAVGRVARGARLCVTTSSLGVQGTLPTAGVATLGISSARLTADTSEVYVEPLAYAVTHQCNHVLESSVLSTLPAEL